MKNSLIASLALALTLVAPAAFAAPQSACCGLSCCKVACCDAPCCPPKAPKAVRKAKTMAAKLAKVKMGGASCGSMPCCNGGTCCSGGACCSSASAKKA